MKTQLFSIRDSALQAHMAPFPAQTRGMATRAFQDAVNDPQQPMNKHPEDYELYHVGEFDDSNAALIPLLPELVARAKDLKNP